MAKCKSCDAEVMFVSSATTGKLQILDATPAANGNIVIVDGKAKVIPKGDLFAGEHEGPRYLDHHASCPDAAKWRRKK